MARTAHHVRRPAALSPEAPSRPWRPWRAVVLHDLRYSSQSLRCAARDGRRPQPQQVRRSVAVYSFARSDTHGGDVGGLARRDERRARQVARHQLGLLRLGPASDFEAEPGRHRHAALWRA